MSEAHAVGERLDGFRPPKQERSRQTLERIARATEALLSERGHQGVTIQDVVARADASVGAFYTRFESRDDAVAYVRERSWEEARRAWRHFLAPDDWTGVPLEAFAAEVIRRFCRIMLAAERPSRAFYLDLLEKGDPDDLERVRRLDREIAGLVGRVVEERAEREVKGIGEQRAEEGFLQVISAVRDQLFFDPGGDERSLILRSTRMYTATLGLEPPESYRELLTMCAVAGRRRLE